MKFPRKKLGVPKIPHAFFKWYCREDRLEEIHGDFEEFFNEREEMQGESWARIFYVLDVVRGCQPYAWKKIRVIHKLNQTLMITNHIRSSLRTIKNNKAYTFINIVGLAMSIACATVIYLIAKYELSFDKHQSNYDTIYRIVIEDKYENEDNNLRATSYYPMAQAVRDEIPDFEAVTFMQLILDCYVSISDEPKDQVSLQQSSAYVDPEFLTMFELKWIQGKPTDNFSEPNQVIISEGLAKKLFGNASQPLIGEVISLDGSLDLKIVGVIKDPLPTTEFPFQMLLSSASLAGNSNYDNDDWGLSSYTIQTYVQLADPDYETVSEKLSIVEEKYLSDEESLSLTFSLQPMSDIHYNPNYRTFASGISMTNLWTLIIIGILLVVIATINYINLSTAKALRNVREVGLRKVLGSSNGQIMLRSFIESAILVLGSIIVSGVLANVLLTYLKEIVGIKQNVTLTFESSLLLLYGVIMLFITIITGIFSSFLQLKQKFIETLKSKYPPGSRLGWIKKGMVIFQFTVTQILIVATIVIFQQIQFYNSKDLGFRSDSIITISLPQGDVETSDLELFKERLAENPSIINASLTFAAPMSKTSANSDINFHGDIVFPSDFKLIDYNYVGLFDLELIAGRNLTKNDSSYILVNEEFVKKLGLDDPADAIGQTVQFWSRDAKILGVLRNFHAASFRKEIPPIFLIDLEWYREINVRIDKANITQALASIEAAWESTFPNKVIDYKDYEQRIADLYESDRSLSFLVNLFCIISILISCLGLFGLVSNQVIQKTRELGIRKVLGASMTNLIAILSKDFVLLVIIAMVIAVPISYQIMSTWLDDFAYRISIGPSAFIIAALLSVVLLAISIGNQSINAASKNPVDSLKDE